MYVSQAMCIYVYVCVRVYPRIPEKWEIIQCQKGLSCNELIWWPFQLCSLHFVYCLLHWSLSSLPNILFESLFPKIRGGRRGEDKEQGEDKEPSMTLSPLLSPGPLSLKDQLILRLPIPHRISPVVMKNPGSPLNLHLFFCFLLFFFFLPGLSTGSGLR